MPSAEQLKALSDAGGFALFLGFVIAAAIGLWRGWWVPGFIALRDQKRADALEAENRTLSVTVATLTAELRQARRQRRDRVPEGRDGPA
jgi:hypothetical protein